MSDQSGDGEGTSGGRSTSLRLLVTAGPTREPVDAVRFLSNRSSGRMGYSLAEAAIARGHQACLITGPVSLKPPHGAELVFVETAREMCVAVLDRLGDFDGLLMCAAVGDYRPAEAIAGKRKKEPGDWTLRLVRNPDILLEVDRAGYVGLRLGFAAEYGDPRELAAGKLRDKRLDLIAANDIAAPGLGMGARRNAVWLLDRWGGCEQIGPADKTVVAMGILQHVEQAYLRLGHAPHRGGEGDHT